MIVEFANYTNNQLKIYIIERLIRLLYHTIISDKDNTERRKLVLAECKKIGIINPHFTDAIMTTRMPDEEVYTQTIPDTFLSKGEVGCALSHKKVYEEFLKTNRKSILIFEDDIVFSKECTLEVLESLMEYVSKQTKPSVLVLQKSRWHNKKVWTVDDNISIYSSRNQFCTHAYMLNRSAAEIILSMQTPIRFEIDAFKFYYWLADVGLYCLNQDLVDQSKDLESGIGSGRFDADNRTELKNKAYKELSKKLPLTGKVSLQLKRLPKALHKPFETLEY